MCPMGRFDVQNKAFKNAIQGAKKHKFNAKRNVIVKNQLYEVDGNYFKVIDGVLYNKAGAEIGPVTISFDSRKEANHYYFLLKDPDVQQVDLQPRFELQPMFKKNGVTYRSIVYVADFKVFYKNGKIKIVDTKGMETREWIMKQKMFEYKYPDLTLEVI